MESSEFPEGIIKTYLVKSCNKGLYVENIIRILYFIQVIGLHS